MPQFRAVNFRDMAVLIPDGDELQGARQNRVLNTSLLVGARSVVPVSCTEHGWWRETSRDVRDREYMMPVEMNNARVTPRVKRHPTL